MSRANVFPNAEGHAFAWSFTVGLVFAIVVIVSTGCGAQASYVAADRKFFDKVIPRYVAYTLADPLLTDAVKQRRIRTTVAKEAKITQAEKK